MGVGLSVLHGRCVLPGDPLFTAADLAVLRQFKAWKREVCPRCGTRHEVWLDDDGYPLSEPPFLPIPYECLGCKAIARHDDTLADKNTHGYRRTVLATADAVKAMEEEA